jgi:hypothetical protein
VTDGTNCAKNITTLAAMRAFSAVETGPGPNEKEDPYADG